VMLLMRALLAALCFCGCSVGARSNPTAWPAPPPAAVRAAAPTASASPAAPAEVAFDTAAGLGSGWLDYGWAPRELAPGQPAKLDLSGRGGWLLAHPGRVGAFGALVLRYRAPAEFGDFLEVRLGSSTPGGQFPRVTLDATYRRALEGGWTEVSVPLRVLNPNALAFDQVTLRAREKVSSESVFIARIALEGSPAPDPTMVAAPAPRTGPARDARFVVDCRAAPRSINPMIYGSADEDDAMSASAIRWGGNPSTRYNWQLGNAWNTSADWFFKNVDYANDPTYSYERALEQNRKRNVATALTVPMIGWVAKDTKSYSFPVSVFGEQEAVAPELPDAGNGKTKSGTAIKPRDPSQTSVPAPPEFIGRWISTIRAKDKERGRSVQMVILDNEPMLWHVTHRDVHPNPVGYDELLARTVSYAAAVRKADPGVLIAGPAEWGWPAYSFSAIDAVAGFGAAPDRKAHGDVPLLPWLLAKVRARERQLGLKLLDVLDVHYYPQAQGVGSATDRVTNALRLRSTRSLWDPTYVDESWIREPVQLIPRLREWIQRSAPGLGISIGEYNFGAAEHPSGGLAQAEALGRFGTEGLTSAFYWRLPPKNSPVFWAFRAYRNFDGRGARFLDVSVPVSTIGKRVSLFASRSAGSDHVVAVLLNLDPDEPVAAKVDLRSCGTGFSERAFVYNGDANGFVGAETSAFEDGVALRRVAPYTITVLDWTRPAQ
jgi:hypothetical protein